MRSKAITGSDHPGHIPRGVSRAGLRPQVPETEKRRFKQADAKIPQKTKRPARWRGKASGKDAPLPVQTVGAQWFAGYWQR